jgi:hypothetical protein
MSPDLLPDLFEAQKTFCLLKTLKSYRTAFERTGSSSNGMTVLSGTPRRTLGISTAPFGRLLQHLHRHLVHLQDVVPEYVSFIRSSAAPSASRLLAQRRQPARMKPPK